MHRVLGNLRAVWNAALGCDKKSGDAGLHANDVKVKVLLNNHQGYDELGQSVGISCVRSEWMREMDVC